MQVTLQNPETQDNKPRISPVTLAIAAIVILAVAAAFWFLFQPLQNRNAPSAGTAELKMSPSEQEYAKRIEVANIALSRMENFLHQEVTVVSGEVYNSGTEPVAALRLTAEFFDELNQVVLRETRSVLGTPEVPLAPGERRAFEISFEHVPTSWNMHQPMVRVSYLRLPVRK